MEQKRIFFLQRMNDHVQYLGKIKKTLVGKGDFQGTDCRHCALGKWLYGEGQEQTARMGDEVQALFAELLEPHAQFHEASARALESHRHQDEVGKYRAMTDMHQLSTRLIRHLLELDGHANPRKRSA